MLDIKACSQSGPTPETAHAAGNVSLQKMCSLRWEQHFGVIEVNEIVAQLQLDSQGKGWAFVFRNSIGQIQYTVFDSSGRDVESNMLSPHAYFLCSWSPSLGTYAISDKVCR